MEQGMGSIILVCAVVLGIVLLKKKVELILNFLLRGVFGGILIYFLNAAMVFFELEVQVGINATSLLTCAILGFPGVFMLFSVMCL